MATFTWLASVDSARETAPRVRELAFGDGYAQRVADGINNRPLVWRLSFKNRAAAEADAIDAFLVARNAVEAFDWTDPYGYVGRWICKIWSRPGHGGGISTITATFTQVFGE